MIHAVLVDLDDTLVDHTHAHRVALAGVRERYAALAGVPMDALLAESQRVLADLHDDVQLGRVSPSDARIERYRRLFAFVGARGETPHAAVAELSRDIYQASRRCVPGARELLVALAPHVRIAIVTNNTTAEQTEKLARFDLATYVDVLVTSADEGVAKPDPRIFTAALLRLNAAADAAVMVGDSLHHDVLAARACGLHACWLDRAGAAKGDEPFVVFDSLAPAPEVAARILAH